MYGMSKRMNVRKADVNLWEERSSVLESSTWTRNEMK